jgi:hypothetical protein
MVSCFAWPFLPLVEEADNLASNVLPPRLLVVHDAGGGENDVTELTRWQEVDDPLLHVAQLDVEAWADHTALVEAGNILAIDQEYE